MTLDASTTWDPARELSGPATSASTRSDELGETREQLGGQLVRIRRAIGGMRATLRREADVLNHIKHPAFPTVYSLHDDVDHTELIISDAGSRTLASLVEADRPLEHVGIDSADQLLTYLKQAARALEDLHGLGWLHGSVSSHHVVISEQSTIRWTHVDQATSYSPTSEQALAAAEWDDFVDVVTQAVHSLRFRRRREQRRWNKSREAFIADLGAASKTQRAVDLDDVTTQRPRWRVALLSAVFVTVLAASIFMFKPQASSDAEPVPEEPHLTHEPAPTVIHNDATYQLGRPGDRIMTGQWDCTPTARHQDTALVVRLDTGEIFWFPEWATSETATSSIRVATVTPNAAIEQLTSDECDVVIANSEHIVLNLPRRP